MVDTESQDIETATTTLQSAPDAKTRRYDRQLRLWAATGQAALELSRILVLSSDATSTSILKNLVLPGIGHFTILDDARVSPADAGNNFFLEGPRSIGKSRAEEAVRLLLEMNDGVQGVADTRSFDSIMDTDKDWFSSFTLIISHNLHPTRLDKLSNLLSSNSSAPPLIIVRSSAFLAEFFIQFHEHTIIESHSETAPSLRIDKPFPALLQHALSLDYEKMDSTEHGHTPYVYILVKAMEGWKKSHGGNPPKTTDERKEFKKGILALQRNIDEENFEEAEAQAYRCWAETKVPSEIAQLFNDPALEPAAHAQSRQPFFHLLAALKRFTEEVEPHTLPLTSTLPDMKADTTSYIHLQRLYKARAEEEKAIFQTFLDKNVDIDEDVIDLFLKNAHGLQVLRGRRWGEFERDTDAFSGALASYPKETCIHLALSALANLTVKQPGVAPTAEALRGEVLAIVGQGTELPDALDEAIGELERAPAAELPNTAALLGGLVAQEAIKMITKQYVPIKGYAVIDLIDTTTATLG
ncbi:hypothetical protein CONPUDRAFT_111872 [Coniophora puteana RWD-64-598 SS2]|uniref:NEDD8-activating enzyme E1 regulatory subunit n=1 Tax=Coniophora puteana (strain RWD-64-598) TaxID=741705 RepID=A0A5M3M9S4_CONPW|nr:uncharacterized protein CONPUDRAFT_111872 [Coniophora puteana RWD-64-598 SS2]EIW75998.1 hypothetical protein CONPUDRAFT_111872 [Coniophora puteana RWD-64-598 SS2]